MGTDLCPACQEELDYLGVILDEAEVVICELLICRNLDCAEYSSIYYEQGGQWVKVGTRSERCST